MLKVEYNEDVREYLRQLKEISITELAQGTLNAMVIGPKAIGKTEMICTTARHPVLVHSFDPGGTKHLIPEKADGRVIADTRFEKEDARYPGAYDMWEKEFDRLMKIGFFDHVGSYLLDSFTHWLGALYNKISRGKFANDGVPEIKGWAIMTNVMKDMVRLATSLPCDFYLTGHVTKNKEELSGRFMTMFAAPPSSQVTIPSLFDEYYIMKLDPSDNKGRVLQTANTTDAVAGTRLGRGKFELHEEPDIKKLMEKAGMDTADKSYPLFQED